MPRGVGSAMGRARNGARADYLDVADDERCLLVQAETVTALDNLEAICAVPGVDVLLYAGAARRLAAQFVASAAPTAPPGPARRIDYATVRRYNPYRALQFTWLPSLLKRGMQRLYTVGHE